MTRLPSRRTAVSLLVLLIAFLTSLLLANPGAADDEADRSSPLTADERAIRAESSGEVGDPGELPDGISLQRHETQVAVDAFLQPLIASAGLGLWASVDWEAGIIELSASGPALDSMKQHDGLDVGGLKVNVSEASVTRAEYERAIVELGKSADKLDVEIRSFSLPPTSDYIAIQVRGQSELSGEATIRAEGQIQQIIDIPFRLSSASEDRWTDRGDSAAPWRGGVQMRHNLSPGAYACSSAFSVLKNGVGYVLSAAHCDHTTSSPRWSWTDWADNSWIAYSSGVVGKTSPNTLDSLLLDPQGGTEGRIYSGNWNASSGTSRYLMSVNGADATYIGSPVCTNGANSGQHCSIEVFDNDDVACASQGVCHRWTAFHTNITKTAVADADSGGSVYFDLGNDRVGARGVISQSRGFVTDCGSTRFGSASQCSNGLLFVGIVDVLQEWGVSIEKN